MRLALMCRTAAYKYSYQYGHTWCIDSAGSWPRSYAHCTVGAATFMGPVGTKDFPLYFIVNENI